MKNQQEDIGGKSSGGTVDLVQGSLDMLILRVLEFEPCHGWGIAQLIRQRSRDVLQVTQGSLYPALHRLERRGLVEAHWAKSENNRRAKFYQLTSRGEGKLAEESANWRRMVEAVAEVMRPSEAVS